MPSMRDRRDDAPFAGRVRAWVTAGLISPEQGDAIRRFEGEVAAPSRRPERLGIAAEVAAYLGSVLALMGGVVVVGQRWREMVVAGRLGIAAAVALVGLAAGSWLVNLAESGTTRLGTFLWAVGTAGLGLGVGVVLHEADVGADVAAIVIGGVVWLVSVTLWRNDRERGLQLLTTVTGAAIAAVGVWNVAEIPVWRGGVVVWGVALLFGVAAAVGRVRPRLFGLAAAGIVAMLGAAMLSDLDEHLGPAMAAVTAAIVVVFALVDRSMPLLVLGIVGFLIATQALLATTFTGLLGSSIVTLLGLAIVVVIIVRARGQSPPTS